MKQNFRRFLTLLPLLAGCLPEGNTAATIGRCIERSQSPRLLVAGSGSTIPLARALADHYPSSTLKAEVADSIGTQGAIRALRDDAIDLGLASRALSAEERSEGFREFPLAQVAVGWVVNGPSPTSITSSELVEILEGRRSFWPSGTPIIPILREKGDSSISLLRIRMPAVFAAVQNAMAAERFTVALTDQEARNLLSETRGAIGLLDLDLMTDSALHTIALDGIAPTEANLLAGRYPLLKTLSLILGPRSGAEANAFVEFAISKRARSVFAERHYLPLTQGD